MYHSTLGGYSPECEPDEQRRTASRALRTCIETPQCRFFRWQTCTKEATHSLHSLTTVKFGTRHESPLQSYGGPLPGRVDAVILMETWSDFIESHLQNSISLARAPEWSIGAQSHLFISDGRAGREQGFGRVFEPAAQPRQNKKYGRKPQADDGAQQPAQVVARRAQHCV